MFLIIVTRKEKEKKKRSWWLTTHFTSHYTPRTGKGQKKKKKKRREKGGEDGSAVCLEESGMQGRHEWRREEERPPSVTYSHANPATQPHLYFDAKGQRIGQPLHTNTHVKKQQVSVKLLSSKNMERERENKNLSALPSQMRVQQISNTKQRCPTSHL